METKEYLNREMQRIYLQRFRNHIQKFCVLMRGFEGKDGLAHSQCREEIEERSER